MSILHIALRDGFRNDTVAINVDARSVFSKRGVTTDLTISRADALDVPTSGATVLVEVSISGGARAAREIDVSETAFVSISRERDGTVSIVPSRQAPLYM